MADLKRDSATLNIYDTGISVIYDPPSPVADIVFVHGLQGHPKRTWTAKAASQVASQSKRKSLFSWRQGADSKGSQIESRTVDVFWPSDLLPEDCPNVRLLTWGYDSHVTRFFKGAANQSGIHAIARDLLYGLQRTRQNCEQRSLLFVAHSLGGIIVKDVIFRAANEMQSSLFDIYSSTRAILFLGTPHRGSSMAETAETLRRIVSASGMNTNSKNLRDLQIDSPMLEEIQERFLKLLQKDKDRNISIHTFQEAKPMTGSSLYRLGDKVVNDISSSLDGSDARETINANHMTMCQYKTRHDDGYQKVSGRLKFFMQQMVQDDSRAEQLKEKRITIKSGQASPNRDTTASSTYSLSDVERHCMALFRGFDVDEYKSEIPQRVNGTCQWILTHPQYVRWVSETSSGILWVSGYAGCGKTMLSAYLSEQMAQAASSSKSGSKVCVFFCDEKIESQRDGKAILRSLIFQILATHRRLIKHVKTAYDIQGEGLLDNFNELWRIFTALVKDRRTGPMNFIIDSIDECEERTRKRFLDGITRMTESDHMKSSPKHLPVKFLITSRPRLSRQYVVDPLKIDDTHSMKEDLQLVIRTKIEEISRRIHCTSETLQFLESALFAKADQTFLWVTLVLRLLEKSLLTSPKDIQHIIGDLPTDLETTYRRFLLAIPDEYQEYASKLLHLIAGSRRPLKLAEIRILLAVQDHHETIDQVEKECHSNILETLEGILGPLVRISESWVSFVHQSIKDYLQTLSTQKSDPLHSKYGVDASVAAMVMAKACMSYLQIADLRKDLFLEYVKNIESSPDSLIASEFTTFDSSDDPYSLAGAFILQDPTEDSFEACSWITKKFPLFEYAATYWAVDFLSCAEPSELSEMAFLLSGADESINSSWFRYYWTTTVGSNTVPRRFNRFLVACYFGHLTTIRTVLAKEQEAPSQDILQNGLYWASRMGHGYVVTHLLHCGSMPNAVPGYDYAPLAVAAQLDHLHVVEALLNTDSIDINHKNSNGRTALSLAASNGHDRITEKFLQLDGVQPDLPDNYGWTPIFWAVGGKHLNVLRKLVTDTRLDINHIDKQGRTVLSWAAAESDDELVECLMTRPYVNVEQKDVHGRNALSFAAEHGRLRNISLLRKAGGMNCVIGKDNAGRNVLSWACGGGHHLIVGYLLKHYPAMANEEDENGWTPLAWALDRDAPKTVQALLESGLVDVNSKDSGGRTALSWAVGYGYEDVVQMLLNIEGVEVDIPDGTGRTPLSWATMYGYANIIRLLQDFMK